MTRANAINRLLLRYWFYNVREEDIASLLDDNIAKASENIEKGYLETDVILSLNHGNKRFYEPRECAILLDIPTEQAERDYPSGLKASDVVQIQGLTATDTA